jgi:hypothetical protein
VTPRNAPPRREGSAPLADWVVPVLRYGTLFAVVLIAAGYAMAELGGAEPSAGGAVVDAIAAGGGDGVAAAGLLALTLVPAVTAGVAAAGFARGGERRMAVVALLVTALIAASLAAAAVIGPAI